MGTAVQRWCGKVVLAWNQVTAKLNVAAAPDCCCDCKCGMCDDDECDVVCYIAATYTGITTGTAAGNCDRNDHESTRCPGKNGTYILQRREGTPSCSLGLGCEWCNNYAEFQDTGETCIAETFHRVSLCKGVGLGEDTDVLLSVDFQDNDEDIFVIEAGGGLDITNDTGEFGSVNCETFLFGPYNSELENDAPGTGSCHAGNVTLEFVNGPATRPDDPCNPGIT